MHTSYKRGDRMSIDVATMCMKRVFGSATRKQIICFLADKASDDGTGIWCSKGTIALNTELSKSTVKRIILKFRKEGIISETGKRVNSHGFTVEYRINLDRVEMLDLITKPLEPARITVNPVSDEPPSGSKAHLQGGSQRTPNHPLTILEPPTRKSAEDAKLYDLVFNKIWDGYPEDRRRNKKTCKMEFAQAVAAGVEQNDILSAVQDYNTTTAGYTRSKVKFSDNWFRGACWEGYIEQQIQRRKAIAKALVSTLERCKTWIKTCDPTCRHITKIQIAALLENGMVTTEMLALAGVAI